MHNETVLGISIIRQSHPFIPPFKKMRKKTALFCSILLLFLTACHSGKEETDYTNGLKIGFLPSTDVLPYIVAQQLGIYDSLNLDLKLMQMESERNRDTLFQQRKTDGSILSPIEAFTQPKQGPEIFPTLTNEGLYYIVASNDSNFTKPEQLKEKCLSVARGAVSGFFADKVLAKLEIGPDDINQPELNNESIRMQMLANGQIDAAVLRDPNASNALQKGCKILVSSSSYPLTLSVTAFSDSILHTREEDIKKLITGYNLAVAYINSHPQKEWLAKAIPAAGLYGTSLQLPPFKKTARLPLAHAKEMIQWMQENGLLPASYPIHYHSHPIVDKIHKELK